MSDLDALPGMSRRPEDWVIDQILHPWSGPLFSMPQAIAALKGRATVLGSSPRFLIDWRWYKRIVGPQCTDNSFAMNSYYEQGLNLIDWRVALAPTPQEVVRRVERIAQAIYDGIFARERGQGGFSARQLLAKMKSLATNLRAHSPTTCGSVQSFMEYLQSGSRRDRDLREFRQWWGRGQQYLSFIMRQRFN